MINKISFIIILSFSTTSFTANLNESFQQQFASVKSLLSKTDLSVSCQKLTEISTQVERNISENSCPTSSDVDFNLCQQQSDSLSIAETQKLKKLLTEVKTINSENCMNLSEDDKVITAVISAR